MRHRVLVCGLLLGLIGSTPAVAGTQISHAELEALRVAGRDVVIPDDQVLPAIEGDGLLEATVKVCITARGKVKSVAIVASSGVEPYDAQILRTVKQTWRFRPYKRKQKALAVCSTDVRILQPPPSPPKRAPDAPAAPAPSKPPVEKIAPSKLEAVRLTGNRSIVPDDATKIEIQQGGKHRLVIPIKLCVDDTGAVKQVVILKSSGFPAYDAKIEAAIRTWTYQPILVDGVATTVCSAVTLIYVQKR